MPHTISAGHGRLAGKLGYRISETSANDTAPFVQNDAWLVIANARMHPVHDRDILIEARELGTVQAQGRDFGVLAAVYKQLGNHLEVGWAITLARFPTI